ncbi:MAG: TrkA C-terminal domain-containing protein, partial [Planctomycetes bacterium]|nr:TrkA C-terminal domain-containing protein [Planctomycetota bacterium]
FAAVPLPDAWVGHAVDALPPDSRREILVVTALRTEDGTERAIAATPDLVLQEGDRVVVMGTADAIRRLTRAES